MTALPNSEWLTRDPDDSKRIHVHPLIEAADGPVHVLEGDDCWCHPLYERQWDGSLLIAHTPADGLGLPNERPYLHGSN